jgi:hypothetical protein
MPPRRRVPARRGRTAGRLLAVLIVAVLAAACGEPPAEATLDPSLGPAAPQVTCLGVPASKCAEFAKQATADGGTVPLVAIRIVCSAAPCFEQSGQVAIDIVYADGRRDSTGTAWDTVRGTGAPPPQTAPPLPAGIKPTCIGLAQRLCNDMARNVMTEGMPGSVMVSVVVTCTAVCNDRIGQGTTIATYDDGTTTTDQWGYGS